MMRRIDLLPARYAEKRRERRNIGVALTAGGLVLLLLVGYWFMLGGKISSEKDALAAAQAENLALQGQIAELQQFEQLDAEVQQKRGALQTVMAGDIDWPALLTELAMVVPADVWLTNFTASAGTTEGSTQVGTEANPVRISNEPAVGRIQFSGSALTMPGVAKWLIRLGTVNKFAAIWLNSATEAVGAEGEGTFVNFESTLELNAKAFSERFQRSLP
jgi:Tfp pilus assembly protein PilN